jgi:glycerophosphoryl diester phosphodiesterase
MKTDPTRPPIDLHDPAAVRAHRPLIVAHRGGVIAANAPENSLGAIQLAALHGYDMVELDVRESKDGVLVLFHGLGGGSLLADCGVRAAVEDLTADELAQISYRGSTERLAGFEEALSLCASSGLGVMLDLKARDPSSTYLGRIADLLHEYKLARSTVTISQHPRVSQELADVAILPLSRQDTQQVLDGQLECSRPRLWFGWAHELASESVAPLQRAGVLVIPSINTFHYPLHAQHALARQDIRRLKAAGVDGFQIDSDYQDYVYGSGQSSGLDAQPPNYHRRCV